MYALVMARLAEDVARESDKPWPGGPAKWRSLPTESVQDLPFFEAPTSLSVSYILSFHIFYTYSIVTDITMSDAAPIGESINDIGKNEYRSKGHTDQNSSSICLR